MPYNFKLTNVFFFTFWGILIFFFFYKMVCPHFPFEQHLETAVNAYFFYAYYRVSKFKFVGNFKVSTSLTMSCKYVHLSTSKYYLEEYVTFEMQSLKISPWRKICRLQASNADCQIANCQSREETDRGDHTQQYDNAYCIIYQIAIVQHMYNV